VRGTILKQIKIKTNNSKSKSIPSHDYRTRSLFLWWSRLTQRSDKSLQKPFAYRSNDHTTALPTSDANYHSQDTS